GGEGGKETNRRGITRPRRSRRGALDPLCGSASILHEARARPARRKDGETDFLLAGERGQRPLSPSGERTSARASGAPVNLRMCCSRKLHEEGQSQVRRRRRRLRSSRSLSTALFRARSRAASVAAELRHLWGQDPALVVKTYRLAPVINGCFGWDLAVRIICWKEGSRAHSELRLARGPIIFTFCLPNVNCREPAPIS
ncbi:MAG: hypothetical protein EOR56_33885, partial [Mesorhizobium sp.]